MATEIPSEPAPTKFSRYRSVRRAQAQAQQSHLQSTDKLQQTPPLPTMPLVQEVQHDAQKDATVARSMSRYHRRPMTSQAKPTAPPGRSQTVDVPPPLPTISQASSSTIRSRAQSSPQRSSSSRAPNNAQPRLPNTSKSRSETSVAKGTREPSDAARAEAKKLMQEETERQRRMNEKLKAETRARLESEEAEHKKQEKLRLEGEEAERLRAQREAQRQADDAEESWRRREEQEHGKRLRKAESSKRILHREEEERKAKYDQASRRAQASPPVSPPKHTGFGLFRRHKHDATISPERAVNTAGSHQSDVNRDLENIQAGGGGAVLGIDAPVSAVNTGDRRVMVVCNKSHMLLPVTPTTTPLMLLKSASTCLTEPINVRTAVLLESFQKVGLQRPLRSYEHVRDVMNSWDDDKQNDLHIVDSISDRINQQVLLASHVPDEKPENMGCYIHYSSKPGKWSKRYFTLRSDGQLVMGKNESSKEKDQENICHLSDFDIYTPTERKLSKVKPPKKICYAVKSQQKSTMFMDESRFVHFFCTNDRNTASIFYKSLHSWRSWYLKHVMGEGLKPKAPEPKATHVLPNRNIPSSTEASHTRNSASVGSHYQLGTFAPLLDLGQFKTEPAKERWEPGSFPEDEPLGRLGTHVMHQRKMSTRAKAPPPISYNLNVTPDTTTCHDNKPSSLTRNTSSQEKDTFAPTGLLGRKYSQRQRTAAERGDQPQKPAQAFTDGPSLLNNVAFSGQLAANDSGLLRHSSVRSNGHHRRTSSDIARSASVRSKPRPLIDLTPQYKEPPQHARKGKAFIPDGGQPLVENATCITLVEDAIKIPSSTDWRARPTTARTQSHGTYGTGGHERTRSLKGRGEALASYAVNNHDGAPTDNGGAFTGGGLLATSRAGIGQGHALVGHGVMDGSKARGPMIDFAGDEEFAQGTLLAAVVKVQGSTGPVVDRDRRRSVDMG